MLSCLQNSCAESLPAPLWGWLLAVARGMAANPLPWCQQLWAVFCHGRSICHHRPCQHKGHHYPALNKKPEEGNTSGSRTFLCSVLLFASSFSSVLSSPSALQGCYGKRWEKRTQCSIKETTAKKAFLGHFHSCPERGRWVDGFIHLLVHSLMLQV